MDLTQFEPVIFSLSAQWAYDYANKKGTPNNSAPWLSDFNDVFGVYMITLREAAKAWYENK